MTYLQLGRTAKAADGVHLVAVLAVTQLCRCSWGRVPRTPNRSVRMDYSEDVADTTSLSAQDPLWVHLGQSRWWSLDCWSASCTVSSPAGRSFAAASVCRDGVLRDVERVRQPRASSKLMFPGHRNYLFITCMLYNTHESAHDELLGRPPRSPGPRTSTHADATRRRISATPVCRGRQLLAGDDA